MLVKIHHAYRVIVAICDTELLGKKFEEGKFQLDVRENFYHGQEVSEKSLLPLIREYAKEDATFMIIGKESVNAALKTSLISKEGIKTIQNIPFAMILM